MEAEQRTRRCSEREPADSLRYKFNAIGGWLPSLTCTLCEGMFRFPASCQAGGVLWNLHLDFRIGQEFVLISVWTAPHHRVGGTELRISV
jgi:hypothetical protein